MSSRRRTPAVLTPVPKPFLSVEEWEAKAPLDDIQTRSVSHVKTASENIPLPLKFTPNEGSPLRPSTPARVRLAVGGVSSRPTTPQPGSSRLPASLTTHVLHPKVPVQTPQQFYDWFALVDRSVAHSQEAHFRQHVASVSEHLDTCDKLLAKIDDVDSQVDGMLEGWRSVEEGGRSLKDACERLLEERDDLLTLTEEIGARLEYFQELEQATRMLNHPGESLVLQTDFLYMVERVDICIEYLKAHRHYRESEVYLLRFQQCMTRAMTLIKMYFVGSLRALTSDIANRLSDKNISATAQNHLLYTRFRALTSQASSNATSHTLTPLLADLERRAQTHPATLASLLSECHTAYFSARKSLLVNGIVQDIRGMVTDAEKSRTGVVNLTRSGCSYIKQLCTDEYELYRKFFNSGEEQMYQYLESLCDYLYDDLRPRIFHEQRLTALCEVCTVIQALMVLDVDANADADEELTTNGADDDIQLNLNLDQNPQWNRSGKIGPLHIAPLLQMVLQDAQTRLFFKAQAVIQAEIRYYTAKDDDLEYPAKLIAAAEKVKSTKGKEEDDEDWKELQDDESWYPTLRKAVWVLSQLRDFVKPAIFHDIAQETLTLTRESFQSAAGVLRIRDPPKYTLDASLFLARHLMVLKEVAGRLQAPIESFGDISAGVAETLANVLNKTTAGYLPQTFFATLGVPLSEDGMREAKHGIDHDLRRACEDVIDECALPIIKPLGEWVEQVQMYRAVHAVSSPRTPTFTSAIPDTPTSPNPSKKLVTITTVPLFHDVHTAFLEALSTDLRSNIRTLKVYLQYHKKTAPVVNVLLGHVKDRIIAGYRAFSSVAQSVGLRGPAEVGVGELKVLEEGELWRLINGVCEDVLQSKI